MLRNSKEIETREDNHSMQTQMGSNDALEEASCWNYVPDSVLLYIFKFLNPSELLSAGQTCQVWNRISYDELLWKHLLYNNFKIDRAIPISPGKTSWYEEYKRLVHYTPTVCSEVLKEHDNQVLHVSCSHDGSMFATSSKDGYIIVWNSSFPAKVKYSHDMKVFRWKYTQFSQFNQTDSLLLVSGVHLGSRNSTSGEIAVFSLQDHFKLQCRVDNKPYDVFGTWYSNRYLLSGDLHWLAHLVSSTGLWINKASQGPNYERHALFRFYNTNASSVRAIMVAECVTDDKKSDSGFDRTEPDNSHGYHNCRKSQTSSSSPVEGEPHMNSIRYSPPYRRAESEVQLYSEVEGAVGGQPQNNSAHCSSSSRDDYDGDDDDLTNQPDKLLIFTSGSKTFTPHQIGFKRIKGIHLPKAIDSGPILREHPLARERYLELHNDEWYNFRTIAGPFDKIDYVIDLHGHIIGMGLSPDHRYLYVNSRPWPDGYVIRNPLDPPPIAQEIDIHVIDLFKFEEVGKMLRSHKAYTPNNECFFIFLDVSNEYVASGAEDKHGYLWDRHYGVCLAKLPHTDVVNSVAFNPVDSGMLITTSDDYLIKIWRSRAFMDNAIGRKKARKLPCALTTVQNKGSFK